MRQTTTPAQNQTTGLSDISLALVVLFAAAVALHVAVAYGFKGHIQF